MQSIPLLDPFTGDVRGEMPGTPVGEIPELVQAARTAQVGWADSGLKQRKAAMGAMKAMLLARAAELVEAVVEESGRHPGEITASEIIATEDLFSFWLGRIDALLTSRSVPFNPVYYMGKRGHIALDPKGVLGVITPWNLPLALPLRPIVPALLAGNTVVWKPSEICAGSSQVLYDIIKASLPDGVLTMVQGGAEQGHALLGESLDAVFFTGSVATGKKVAAQVAGRIDTVELELGGKDAALVLSDAPLKRTVPGLVWGAFFAAGQNCAAIERLYVPDDIHDQLVDALVAETKTLRLDQEVPPVRTRVQLDRIKAQLEGACAAGAKIVLGGEAGEGHRFPPTIVVDVDPAMALMNEETFGPVLPIRRYTDLDAVIEEINQCDFGLTVSVWTKDPDYGAAIVSGLKAGVQTVNNHGFSGAIPGGTWGGRGATGGGVTGSELALHKMVQPRTVIVEHGPFPKEVWWFPYNDRFHQVGTGLIELTRQGGDRLQGVRGALTGFVNRWKEGT